MKENKIKWSFFLFFFFEIVSIITNLNMHELHSFISSLYFILFLLNYTHIYIFINKSWFRNLRFTSTDTEIMKSDQTQMFILYQNNMKKVSIDLRSFLEYKIISNLNKKLVILTLILGYSANKWNNKAYRRKTWIYKIKFEFF